MNGSWLHFVRHVISRCIEWRCCCRWRLQWCRRPNRHRQISNCLSSEESAHGPRYLFRCRIIQVSLSLARCIFQVSGVDALFHCLQWLEQESRSVMSTSDSSGNVATGLESALSLCALLEFVSLLPHRRGFPIVYSSCASSCSIYRRRWFKFRQRRVAELTWTSCEDARLRVVSEWEESFVSWRVIFGTWRTLNIFDLFWNSSVSVVSASNIRFRTSVQTSLGSMSWSTL